MSSAEQLTANFPLQGTQIKKCDIRCETSDINSLIIVGLLHFTEQTVHRAAMLLYLSCMCAHMFSPPSSSHPAPLSALLSSLHSLADSQGWGGMEGCEWSHCAQRSERVRDTQSQGRSLCGHNLTTRQHRRTVETQENRFRITTNYISGTVTLTLKGGKVTEVVVKDKKKVKLKKQ